MAHHRVGRLGPRSLGAIALGILMLTTLAPGAGAEDAPAPSRDPQAEGATPALEPAPAAPSAAGESASAANPAGTPPRRFIPTEQVSEDRAVAFPKDI
jgi:hypothetical protein